MKKYILIIILLVATVAFAVQGFRPVNKAGQSVEPGQLHTYQDGWNTVGSFAAATTTRAVDVRDYTNFVADGNNAVYRIESGWNKIRVRCSSTTDADSTVIDVFLMNGASDYFNRVATLTFTTGTQTAGTSGYEFADGCAESNANWHNSGSVMNPGGNYVAEWAIDHCGSTYIGFCPTTITHTAILEITGY